MTHLLQQGAERTSYEQQEVVQMPQYSLQGRLCRCRSESRAFCDLCSQLRKIRGACKKVESDSRMLLMLL